MADLANGRTLDSLERLGRILNLFGVPLLGVLFITVYFGWLPSPLLARAESIERVLVKHDQQVAGIIVQRTQETHMLSEALNRVADILKMIDCGDITDARLRDRCLAR